MLKTEDINAEVDIVFQSIEGLHEACPGHTGDWYLQVIIQHREETKW